MPGRIRYEIEKFSNEIEKFSGKNFKNVEFLKKNDARARLTSNHYM